MTRLSVRGLRHGYGGPEVLRGVDFDLAAGESCLLLGPNGAGKSTLLGLLAGLGRPLKGEIRIEGRSLDPRNPSLRRQLGFLSHASFSYSNLTVRENLRFTAELYGVDNPDERVRHLLGRVSLRAYADRPARALSRGMSQRLSLARSVLHQPRLLLLDEPLTGLDLEGVNRLTELTEELRGTGTSILTTTHDLAHLRKLGRRLAWLHRGCWEDMPGLDLHDTAQVEAAYLERFAGGPAEGGGEA